MVFCGESHERIRRADRHARDFLNGCIRFLNDEPKPFSVTHKIKDDRNGVVVLVPQKILHTDLPFVLGEFFYQLRAALDGAMWKAFEHFQRVGPVPTVKERQVYFPITEPGNTFKRDAIDSIPLPTELKAWIEAIQPHNVTNRTPGSEEAIVADALLYIHKFARLDRHRKPHLIASVVSEATSLIKCAAPAKITGVQSIRANPLEGQYEIATFQIEGATPTTELYIEGQITLEIQIEGAPNHLSFFTWLPHLKDQAFRVIERFDKAFK
jgi:hypothetical protein